MHSNRDVKATNTKIMVRDTLRLGLGEATRSKDSGGRRKETRAPVELPVSKKGAICIIAKVNASSLPFLLAVLFCFNQL
jgi:hypothetical protein